MNKPINLISAQTQSHFRARAAVREWRKITICVFILVTTFTLAMQFSVHQVGIATKKQQNLADFPQQVARKNSILRTRLTNIVSQQREQRWLRSERGPLAVLQLLTETKQSLDGKLMIESFDFALDTANPPEGSGQPANTLDTCQSGKVKLQVVTDSTTSSSKFLQLLENSNYFEKVVLTTDLSKLGNERDDIRLGVECQF